jgi:hypothetical protein
MSSTARGSVRGRRVARGAVALALVACPTALPAPLVPPQKYVLINGSGFHLTCTVQVPGQGWSAPFQLSSGAQWDSKLYDAVPRLFILCGKPVVQRPMSLERGKRYAIGRPAHGVSRIVEVVA